MWSHKLTLIPRNLAPVLHIAMSALILNISIVSGQMVTRCAETWWHRKLPDTLLLHTVLFRVLWSVFERATVRSGTHFANLAQWFHNDRTGNEMVMVTLSPPAAYQVAWQKPAIKLDYFCIKVRHYAAMERLSTLRKFTFENCTPSGWNEGYE